MGKITINAETKPGHKVNFKEKYPTWGTSGSLEAAKVPKDMVSEAVTIFLNSGVNVQGFELHSAMMVDHYQGENYKPIPSVLLRYQRKDGVNSSIGVQCRKVQYFRRPPSNPYEY
jgi:hypothetical protein